MNKYIYAKILKSVGVTAASIAVISSLLQFNNLGVKELLESKINGLLQNNSTLQSQKTTLLGKVDELSGNIGTLTTHKEQLLSELQKQVDSNEITNEELAKFEKLVEQLQERIDLITSERDSLLDQINNSDQNNSSLQEQLAKQRQETEKANDYIRELYDYLNTINVESVPELENLPTYTIESLDDELNKILNKESFDVVWNISQNNPNYIFFIYQGLYFHITEEDDGSKSVWLASDSFEDGTEVTLEYTGVDDITYKQELLNKVYNILDTEPKKYNKITIKYPDGTKTSIGIVQ